jgi:hypothetical protein
MLNFCGIVSANLKMETGRNFSMSGINSGRWNRTMLNLYGIVSAILKMATPQYRTNSTLSDFNAISYVGRLWCPELIPDIEKFLLVAIFKMADTIPYKFNIVHIWNGVEIGQCWICAVLWWAFWKWRPVEIFQCQESIRDIIIYTHIKFWWYRTMLNFFVDICL